jgi:hypothetical protein
MDVSVNNTHIYSYVPRIKVELGNLCLIPSCPVHGGTHDLLSLKKMYNSVSCIMSITALFVPLYINDGWKM